MNTAGVPPTWGLCFGSPLPPDIHLNNSFFKWASVAPLPRSHLHSYLILLRSPSSALHALLLFIFPQHLEPSYLQSNFFIMFILRLPSSACATWMGIFAVLLIEKSRVHRAVPGTQEMLNKYPWHWNYHTFSCCNYEAASQNCGFDMETFPRG